MIIRMALRNLRRNFRRTAFAGSLAGLGAIIGMISVGFMTATFFVVKEQTIRSGIGHFQVAHAGEFDGFEETPMEHALSRGEVATIEAALPQGATALPRIAFEGIASFGDRSLVFIAQAIDPDAERMMGDWSRKIVAGTGLSGGEANRDTVVLGTELARLLGVAPGGAVTLVVPTPSGGLNAADVKVLGLVSQGVRDIDRVAAIVPLGLAQSLIGTDGVDRVSVLLNDESGIEAARARIERVNGKLTTRSWRSLAPLYDQLVSLYSRQFGVFGAVIGAMIAIAVVNSIAMAVLERRRETATLLALGFPRAFVRRMFMAEGAGMALLGGIAGVGLGFILIRIINSAGIPMPPAPGTTEGYRLHLMEQPLAGAAALILLSLLGTAAGWLASGSVRSDRIVEGLRHD